ncbi:MAG: phosphoenolpyruvate synthase [Candidatus Kerfeldbacteria bacterium RIFCSPLOWO2_01_FULL_48_11]|uniref:Phosphoenolpyruvate synthase n=1 Tax=Candidatus Kerfeldbacteria bacterium RIFCSPLOWO2_01_FULL_48_11 TaxID=1798543 RepID=A0A1G2B5T2_9BACT|nr:MAG: Phosphoenolpyruvate synthase [Parcubacteria group bacterium GW2011_GWA2_48_9]OGY83979.1 MAG: phosphoenolpyruvate synthase [Candidatus Kerfeldbacteria bacterium RIFCSPLOWO2_01_FULL_48_11]HCJ52639.1 phosphoenolpyruvate synthase [Candidatus Kerfeldbacteria bacterium]
MSTPSRSKRFILWFRELGIRDVPLVGGKNASLGEMYQKLVGKGVSIPNGFAITAHAYFYLLEKAGIRDDIKRVLKDLNTHDIRNLQAHGKKVRELIMSTTFPKDLENLIVENYRKLEKQYGKGVDVAVRSSATAEDLPDASFAGQQETYLNIRGPKALLEACKKCFASLFTDRAVSYRVDKHFDHFSIGLSIGVQKMVRSDKGASGVMFSIDTESGHKDMVLINASYGLGENIVQGAVSPDEYYIHKPTLKKGFNSIVSKALGTKKIKMIYSTGAKPTVNISVKDADRRRFCITDKEALKLAKWACIIEDHYTKEAGHFKPMDMEWAKDGVTGQLFIVQARPETVVSQRDASVLEHYTLVKKGKPLASGSPVGAKIGVGRANVIKDVKQILQFKKGDVLITKMTDPDWEPIMKIASAIVTDEGGRTSHAAIVSRELGIPAIVGAEDATKRIPHGKDITVSCSEGDIGYVYAGRLPFKVKKTSLKNLHRPKKTKIKMIFGTPELAFQTSHIPNDGVGLAREEFIINSYIKVHPMALVKYPHLKDRAAIKEIDALTTGYQDKKQYYVDKLSYGIATIAAAFYPREVIVRLADFRSNEYAELIGGKEFEPDERNPMIGWRGASRYYDPKYRPAFDLECKALKRVRDEMGLVNVKVMVPFCRTVEEGKKVIQVMALNGLKQHVNGLEVYVMCEIPSNVVLADQFSKVFDGFSIGSNDLTQLTLGLDRDSGIVAHVGNENNEAVKRLVQQVIRTAKKYHRHIGICGQAPSDFPDFAKFLLKHGIDSISLNPDVIIETTMALARAEKKT